MPHLMMLLILLHTSATVLHTTGLLHVAYMTDLLVVWNEYYCAAYILLPLRCTGTVLCTLFPHSFANRIACICTKYLGHLYFRVVQYVCLVSRLLDWICLPSVVRKKFSCSVSIIISKMKNNFSPSFFFIPRTYYMKC
jgi:hypothetical protein